MFLLKTTFALYPKIILLVLSLIFAITNSLIFIKNKLSQKTKLSSEKTINIKKSDLESLKIQLRSASKRQDSHQGILLNLSRVEKRLENINKAEEYLRKAESQNPNSDYFQN